MNKLKAFNGYSWKVTCTGRCYLKDVMDFGYDTRQSALDAWNKRELSK